MNTCVHKTGIGMFTGALWEQAKIETTQMPISSKMNKSLVVDP